jgi:hypothetical protein
MGFNGVRKHQKIEDPRYLYWADRIGLLIWEEMPSAYRFTRESIERVTTEWLEVLRRDHSHPCIVVWVPFNDSDLLRAVNGLPVFCGCCYIQFADTYQEANGLLYPDRTPKFPLSDMARATLGL